MTYESLCSIFAINVRRLRISRGLSQRKLARQMKCSQTYLCHVEQKKRKPTIRLIHKLSNLLGCGPDELLRLDVVDKAKT